MPSLSNERAFVAGANQGQVLSPTTPPVERGSLSNRGPLLGTMFQGTPLIENFSDFRTAVVGSLTHRSRSAPSLTPLAIIPPVVNVPVPGTQLNNTNSVTKPAPKGVFGTENVGRYSLLGNSPGLGN